MIDDPLIMPAVVGDKRSNALEPVNDLRNRYHRDREVTKNASILLGRTHNFGISLLNDVGQNVRVKNGLFHSLRPYRSDRRAMTESIALRKAGSPAKSPMMASGFSVLRGARGPRCALPLGSSAFFARWRVAVFLVAV